MKKTIEAIYEGGALHPLRALDLRENEHVMIIIESSGYSTAVPSDKPWMKCAGILPHEDAEEIQAAIEAACEQVNENGWK